MSSGIMESVEHRELGLRVDWRQTGNNYFPWAAKVGGEWWVLRLNDFPDHPLYTFFVAGQRRFDVDDLPGRWRQQRELVGGALAEAEADEALGPIASFLAYGSEVGTPCDNPFCCG